MSDSDEEYEYESYDEDEGDTKNASEGKQSDWADAKQSDMRGGTSSLSAGASYSAGSSSAPGPATGISPKKFITSCADGEVRLLHMSDIIGPMQSKISQIADLLDVTPAAAAAMLRKTSWSQEKLTDRFWADPDAVLSEAGIHQWEKGSEISKIGTAELPEGSPKGFNSYMAVGAQEGAEGTGLQTKGLSPSSEISLGLPPGYNGVALPGAPAGTLVTCRICFLDVNPDEALASPCGHFFCNLCYHEYLSTKVGDGPGVVFATCPEHKCGCLIPPEVWFKSLGANVHSNLGSQADAGPAGPAGGGGVPDCDGSLLVKFSRFILEQFVSNSRQMRWCPAAGCERIVMAGAGVANVHCKPGGCGNAFCFKCGEEAHQPSSCSDLVRWTEKCQNESETANWILANTKRCPKCTTRIEKNQGCNHMSCSQCKYEFCWMCMGDWAAHGANTGGYYKCNKFDPSNSSETDDAAGRAKRELDRYLHYFKRYQAHHSAQLFAEKQLVQTEKRMGELQETTGGSSWIDVQFLKTANEMVIECRRTLKFTYVFGFYLTSPQNKGDTKHRDLFENMQEDLERYTELVSELTEMPIEKMTMGDHKESIINNTRVVEKFLDNLIQGCDEGLDAIGSTGAAEMMEVPASGNANLNEERALQEAIDASLRSK